MSIASFGAGAGTKASPQAFAVQHQRPRNSFVGCSRIGDYELLGKLGEGTFGEVHRARSKKTGAVVALKKIIMHNEKDGFPITALREIKLLKLLSHKNVLKMEDMAVEHPPRSTDKRKKPIIYMATPYMDHDLSGLLDNPSIKFTEPQIKCYLQQLLEGLKYLHENKILHRDMKAANLLISNKGILQIADFGLARLYDEAPPKKGCGGGDGRRDYTSLVVTRWYRPPELLLHLKKYTTAIDMWGVGCVFGEMLWGKPILAGESDGHQLDIIFDLCGSPTDENMPGWRQLPGAEGIKARMRPGDLGHRFGKFGPGAVSLLKQLLRLDWKKRINAIDALEHPYLHSAPLPAKPGDLPTMEESHELDRRKFHDRKAALPPAPKGGTVGRGPQHGAGGPDAAFNSADGYGRNGVNGGRYPPSSQRPGPAPGERMPAWSRGPHGLPPRPPPAVDNYGSGHRDRDRPLPRSRGPAPGGRSEVDSYSRSARNDIDTYIPSYAPERPDRYEQDHRRRDRGGEPRRTRSRSPMGSRVADRAERDHRDRR
ncbi:kinase-like domain-containing protein [Coniella lustricola]|uniref:Serine/threonine-protein kinase BUR1 n=1 Tax=Coniella lustricola TaxID=2025994 RepID=A0A2T3AL47_9PEZI|nr:kinase-like domain-containing protein [Coniella lustricola]